MSELHINKGVAMSELHINTGVSITIAENGLSSTGLKDPCPYCESVECYQHVADLPGCNGVPEQYETEDQSTDRRIYNAAIDGLESLLLSLYHEGYRFDDEKSLRAITTAIDAITNNLS